MPTCETKHRTGVSTEGEQKLTCLLGLLEGDHCTASAVVPAPFSCLGSYFSVKDISCFHSLKSD